MLPDSRPWHRSERSAKNKAPGRAVQRIRHVLQRLQAGRRDGRLIAEPKNDDRRVGLSTEPALHSGVDQSIEGLLALRMGFRIFDHEYRRASAGPLIAPRAGATLTPALLPVKDQHQPNH